MRVEARLIHAGATTGAFGDVAWLRLRRTKQLIGELGVALGQLADDLDGQCPKLDRTLLHAKLLKAEQADLVEPLAAELRVHDNVQGGVDVHVHVNVKAI